jgi:hypothetical protein
MTKTHAHEFYQSECEICGYRCAHEDQGFCGEGIYCPTCDEVIYSNDDLRHDAELARAEMDAEDRL